MASKPQTGFASKFCQKLDLNWIISVSNVVILNPVGVQTNEAFTSENWIVRLEIYLFSLRYVSIRSGKRTFWDDLRMLSQKKRSGHAVSHNQGG